MCGLRLSLLDRSLPSLSPLPFVFCKAFIAGRGTFSLDPSNMKLLRPRSSLGLLRFTISRTSRSVAPLSSRAVRNLASSLHNSQSSSSFARESKRTNCSELELNSSKVWRMSRYPPAVFNEPLCNDSSKSSCGGGRYANRVRHDRTSVFRVHCTTMSRYCLKEERKDSTPGSNAVSGGGEVSTSSSRTLWRSISREWAKYSKLWYCCARCNAADESYRARWNRRT